MSIESPGAQPGSAPRVVAPTIPEIPAAPWCLFLDVDGTLLDIAPTPAAVHVDAPLLDLLRDLQRACDGAVALVSGRTIADLDGLFAPLLLPVAGVHGFERRDAQGAYFRPKFVGTALMQLRSELTGLVPELHGTMLEDKGCAFALHFRQAPHLEEVIRLRLARLAEAARSSFEILDGDHVIEIKPVEHNKATAISAFMQEVPFFDRMPIFIGDDTTDLDGFAAARRFNGLPIGVGKRVTIESHLAGPAEVRAWLTELAQRTPRR